MQVAAIYAEAGILGTPDYTALRVLTLRYPNDPLVWAAVVCADVARCHINRPDLAKPLLGVTAPPRQPQPDTLNARLLNADAARGEQIDPSNALFAFARAQALFALHRDAEALAAIERGGRTDRWDDYSDHCGHATIRLVEEQVGPTSAIERSASIALTTNQNLERMAAMREETRTAIGWAILLERTGHEDPALRIRVAIERWGSLMRRDAHTAIQSMVGMAIEAIALSRGSTGARTSATTLTEAQKAAREVARVAWLQGRLSAFGKPDLAVGLAQAHAASQEAHNTLVTALNRDATGIQRLVCMTALLATVCSCILGLTWMLALAALARARACRTRTRAWALGSTGVIVSLLVNGIAAYRTAVLNISSADINTAPYDWKQFAVALLLEATALIMPAIALIASGIVHRKTGQPFSACLRRVTPHVALVTALGLVIALWWLSSVNAAAVRDQEAAISHESRTFATIAGKRWPEAVMPKL